MGWFPCPDAQDECLLDTCTYITLFYIYLYIHCIYTVIINKPGPCRKQRKGVGGRVKRGNGLRERKTEREVRERVNEGEAAGKHAKRRRLFPAHSLPPLHTDTTERVNTRRLALKLAQ